MVHGALALIACGDKPSVGEPHTTYWSDGTVKWDPEKPNATFGPRSTPLPASTWGCSHFPNVWEDANDGLLTPQETRTKMQEVMNDLRGTPAYSPARRVVASLTGGVDV